MGKVYNLEIAEEDWEMVYLGICSIKNLRETGDIGLSLEDARKRNIKVNAMTPEQMESSLRARKLISKLLDIRHER